MSKVAIVTDSNSGITQAEGKELDIFVVPMPFYINGKLYYEERTLSQEEFYQHLSEKAEISTSMPAMTDVTELWDKLLQVYEEIIYIPMSSGLSSSCPVSYTHLFKKLAASVLTAAMLLQQCGVTTLAEEAQTQAETQIQTQAETPAPETQAPQTETSAPETQAPQTETEKATEKETEKKKEKETEASDRINDGKKIEESTVTSRLGSVRTKLFAADSVILPDTLKEQVGADWILDGTDGKAAVDGLSGLSKTLANGQSTSKVEVINLYADKDGKLDTKQLEKLFKDKVIDVTDQYFVVNIIAAKKDQTLSFSGYAMKNKGQNVSYTKATQAGDILYNFATLEKGKYQAFEGTVNLSSGSGLQGTFLAPKAAVTVGSDLSGAVYAKKVTVADGVQKLLRVAYIKGAKDEAETEAVTEAATETESDTEAQTEQVTEAQMAGVTEAQTEQITEAQTAGVTEAQTEQVTEMCIRDRSETMREWTNRIADTHYVLGSVMGPHPFPTIVRDFQAVISKEIRQQMLEKEGRLPDAVLACVGGGSNAIGTFYHFIEDEGVRLIGCEAAGRGVNTAETAATIATGRLGIFHGMKSYFCQDEYGQIAPVYSISAGLDYPGIGPEHAHLYDTGRAEYVPVTDEEAVDAFEYLSRIEGIIPAIESAHAVAYAKKLVPTMRKDQCVVITISGRGDKDCAAIARYRGEDIHE